jgi:drug/metabolite transporter (DMT)-like permease
LTYLFAVLAAVANAVSSVLQRKANQAEPSDDNMSYRLIVDLLHKPVWFGGILGVIAGFLLQAAALSTGPLSAVEPILILELPVTLILAGFVFHRRLHRREWVAAAAITVGVAGLLYFLAPRGGSAGIPGVEWGIGIGATLALVAALVAWSRRDVSQVRKAAVLGVATGVTFGLTAALMKAMTNALEHGFVNIFTTWQTYAMIVAGGLAMFLLQSALNAGPLVAAQPGFTAADPVVAILWGVLIFGEHVRGGWYLVLVVVSVAVAAWGMGRLSRSPLVTGATADTTTSGGHESGGGGTHAA